MRMRSVAQSLSGIGLLTCLAVCGCKWQADEYTTRFEQRLANWDKEQEFERTLGEPYSNSEQAIFFRPPKGATLVQAPEGVAALFQGGTPMMEVVVISNNGAGTMQDFVNLALNKLAAAKKAPSAAPTPHPEQPEYTANCRWGGQTKFQLHVATEARNINNTPTDYTWALYFTEEPNQQVLVCFIIPLAKYGEYGQGMTNSLESLALGSKFSNAVSGITAR